MKKTPVRVGLSPGSAVPENGVSLVLFAFFMLAFAFYCACSCFDCISSVNICVFSVLGRCGSCTSGFLASFFHFFQDLGGFAFTASAAFSVFSFYSFHFSFSGCLSISCVLLASCLGFVCFFFCSSGCAVFRGLCDFAEIKAGISRSGCENHRESNCKKGLHESVPLVDDD